MEIFAHFDIINSSGVKVAEGHKASFCLEDNQCSNNAEPVYKCANYGDQGISVNCTDTYAYNIDCQWIDITDIDPGIYTFKVIFSFLNHLYFMFPIGCGPESQSGTESLLKRWVQLWKGRPLSSNRCRIWSI